MFFVYILLCKDGTYYTGFTTDLDRRLLEHNTSVKGARYTSARRPVKLLFHEKYETRSLAQKREAEIKAMSRRKKEELLLSQ